MNNNNKKIELSVEVLIVVFTHVSFVQRFILQTFSLHSFGAQKNLLEFGFMDL